MVSTISGSRIKARLHGLDYLRGLCALGIMAYHYSSWTFGEQPASSFLGRVGIYGVAIFYILSGQTLGYIYNSSSLFQKRNLVEFYKKRFFRIFPLLWLATIISIILSKHFPNTIDFLLNITGLFGLFKWDTYFATGAWSLGNELVFYLLFPLFIFLIRKHWLTLFFAFIIPLAIYSYFALHILNHNIPLAGQWHNYTNPLNQLLLFVSGVLLGSFILPNSTNSLTNYLIGVTGLVVFLLIPIQGNAIELVTGPSRFFFTGGCILLCYSFFSTAPTSAILDKPLSLLGKASYSLYLLHPIVYNLVKAIASFAIKQGVYFPAIATLCIAIPVSLAISYLSYEYFETFFIRLNHSQSKDNTTNAI